MLDDITACVHMRVCPVALLDAFSLEAWRCYQVQQSGRSPWGLPFYDEPAVFHLAASIIDSELGIIHSERRALNGGG